MENIKSLLSLCFIMAACLAFNHLPPEAPPTPTEIRCTVRGDVEVKVTKVQEAIALRLIRTDTCSAVTTSINANAIILKAVADEAVIVFPANRVRAGQYFFEYVWGTSFVKIDGRLFLPALYLPKRK